MTWRLWPLLPERAIPRYLEHMEEDHGLRFVGLGWLPIFAKYKKIHPLHAVPYDIHYLKTSDTGEIQEFFDICEASGWEPVLQQGPCKIFRAHTPYGMSGGTIPLFMDEEEEREHWKDVMRRQLFGIVLLSGLFLFLIWILRYLIVDFYASVNLYRPGVFEQLFTLLLGPLMAFTLIGVLIGFISLRIPFNTNLPSIFYGIGHIARFLSYGGTFLFFLAIAMSTLVEGFSVGGGVGAVIGSAIGDHRRRWKNGGPITYGEMKGVYGMPRKVSFVISFLLPVIFIGFVGCAFLMKDEAEGRNQPYYVETQNLTCERIIYDAAEADGWNNCVYQLRDNSYMRRDMDKHRDNLMEAMRNGRYHYLTEAQLAAAVKQAEDALQEATDRGWADPGYNIVKDEETGRWIIADSRNIHLAAMEKIGEALNADAILVHELGIHYLIRIENRVYRLKSPMAFYDAPFVDEPEDMEALADNIIAEIQGQKDELDKMFYN